MANTTHNKKTSTEELREECVQILEEMLLALHARADDDPGEHNVPEIQRVRQALILLNPPTLF